MDKYKKLIVWRVADDLAYEVYRASRDFPSNELYGLTSQVKRSAISVASNIVEGVGRQGKAETKHFSNIALGSLAETEYLLHFAKRMDYLSDEKSRHLHELTERLGALLWNFYKSF